jgi:type IV pilus assembly protein PilC
MPVYKYEAINKNNKKVVGAINGNSVEDAEKKLYQQGLLVKSLNVSDLENNRYGKVKTKQLTSFCKEMSNMLASGIPLVKAFSILKKRDNGKNLNKIFAYLYKEIQMGTTLSTAMEACGRAFPPLLINMIKAGESNGKLSDSFEQMARHYEKDARLNGKVKGAMVYPVILIAVGLIALVLMFTMILPQFFSTFDGMELPATTKLLMAMSSALSDHAVLILGVVIGFVIVAKYLYSVESIKIKVHKYLLKMPVVGKLMKTIYTSRFARTLSSLYSSGIPLVRCMDICRKTIGNLYIEGQFDEVVRKIKSGSTLTNAIALVEGFDEKLIDEIYIGEESGRLDFLLTALAESFDAEAEEATSRLTALIEPILICVIGVCVGFIAISVITPLMSIYETAGDASSYL